jgi:hypothetical protein
LRPAPDAAQTYRTACELMTMTESATTKHRPKDGPLVAEREIKMNSRSGGVGIVGVIIIVLVILWLVHVI